MTTFPSKILMRMADNFGFDNGHEKVLGTGFKVKVGVIIPTPMGSTAAKMVMAAIGNRRRRFPIKGDTDAGSYPTTTDAHIGVSSMVKIR